MEKLLKVRYVSLPNLIVNNSVVPELLVHNCTPDAIVRELTPLLQPSPKRDWQIAGYKNMRRRLGTSVATDYAAELIVDQLNASSTPVSRPERPRCPEHPERPRRRHYHRRRPKAEE